MIDNASALTTERLVGTGNADPAELAKFSALAHRWWDPQSEFKPLHDINPLRLQWIDELAGGLAGKRVADLGCGGGILAEAMAGRGAPAAPRPSVVRVRALVVRPAFSPAGSRRSRRLSRRR